MVACSEGSSTIEPPAAIPESTLESELAGTTEVGGETGATGLEEIIAIRAPQPTATPDRISQKVTESVESTRLEGTAFLGLPVDDWINLVISFVIIVIAYVIGALLTKGWVSR